MKQYDSLSQIIDELREREQNRKLISYNLEEFRHKTWGVYPAVNPEFVTIGEDWKMTKFAFAQMCKRFAYIFSKPVNANYLWAHPDVLAHAMPIHIEQQREYMFAKYVARKARTGDDEKFQNLVMLNVHNNDKITAFLSTNYRGVPNAVAVEKLAASIGRSSRLPIEINMKTYDDYYDTIDITVIFERMTDTGNYYGAGINLRNSQNGLLGISVAPVVKANTCNNSIVQYMAAYNRHTKGVNSFFDDAVDKVPELIELAVAMYNNSRNLRNIVVENMDTAIDTIISAVALPKALKDTFIEGLTSEFDEPDTLYAFVSAITFVAQEVDNPQKELRLNNIAGTICNTFGAYANTEVTIGEIKSSL